jgi:hypothetical protein
MTTVLLALLVGLSLYLAMRLSSLNTENVSLRAQVTSLKRQLVKRKA